MARVVYFEKLVQYSVTFKKYIYFKQTKIKKPKQTRDIFD